MKRTIRADILGEGIEEGTLRNWFVTEGERVEKHQLIAAIETDKVTVEIETDVGGVVQEILVPEGANLSRNQIIAVIKNTDKAKQKKREKKERARDLELRQMELDAAATEAQAQRDHEEKLAIIAHETARENRLAAEATAKVAATAQEQANQSLDGLLKGLQGNGEG